MEIDVSLLPQGMNAALGALAAAVLLLVLYVAPWRQLRAVPMRQHLFFLVTLCLALLWAGSFRPATGITLHLLGMTAATLLLGGALATLAALLALLFLALLERAAFPALPLGWLLSAVVPAFTVSLLLRLPARFGFSNLFVFLLGIGFAGAMVSVLAVALCGLLVLAAAGQEALVAAALRHATMLPLLLFPEGFLNGAVVSMLTVYFPHLVRGFDENRFLGDR
ncbi:MAG: energy-coupling factor ABC transporter permease [Pseudomonadota bacterium]